MKHAFIHRSGAPRLIIIFAGWGMDENPFRALTRPGYDIMVVWDYRTLLFKPAWVEGYDEICVLAWSMGVQAAQICHKALGNKVTARIAIAGTPQPVNDENGIPVDIFTGTLNNLNEGSIERFMRRMCGGAKAYAGFSEIKPQRPVDELREELQAIGTRGNEGIVSGPRFDHYLLTTRDAIFPPDNQRRAFAGSDIIELDSPHLPDFQSILNNYFIDKSLVTERFAAAHDTYDANAEAQALIADYLANLLCDTDSRAILSDSASHVIEIGCGTGLLSRRMRNMHAEAQMQFWDITPTPPRGIAPEAYRCCDAENAIRLVPDASIDMILSASAMQWFNSPERFVAEAMRALRPGGILAVSTFRKDNMRETAEASGISLHLADTSTWREALKAIPDAETVLLSGFDMQCRFGHAIDALRHLSLTGVNAISRHGANARAIAARMRPDAHGLYTLTYAPLFILLRKKS